MSRVTRRMVGGCMAAMLLLTLAGRTAGRPFTASELLVRVDRILYPQSFSMTVEMTTRRPERPANRSTFELFHRSGSGTYLYFTAPPRLAGTRLLAKDARVWMYQPASGAETAIELSGRSDFFGSVFFNSDLTDLQYSDDYAAERLGEATIDHPELGSVDVWRLVTSGATDKAMYGRVVVFVQKDPLLPVRMDLYSQSGVLFRRMILSEPRRLAGRIRPAVLRVESLRTEGESTTMTIETMARITTFPEDLFTRRRLTEPLPENG